MKTFNQTKQAGYFKKTEPKKASGYTKKVLYVFHLECLFSRGGEKYIFELIKRLSSMYSVTLVVENISPGWKKQYKGVNVIVYKTWSPKHQYWLLLPWTILINFFRLRKFIHKRDIIFTTNFPFNFLATLLSDKVVFHCFEPLAVFFNTAYINSLPFFSMCLVRLFGTLYSPFARIAVQRCALCSGLNHSIDTFMLRAYNKSPDFYISPGIDGTFFTTNKKHFFPRKNKWFTLLHSTDYTVLKNTPILIEALQQVTKVTPNVRLVISESMPNIVMRKKYESLAIRLGVDKHVLFIGGVSEKKLPAFYSSGDVFCFTGFPLCASAATSSMSVIESEACSTPVIRSPSHTKEVINAKTGFIIRRYSADGIARIIIKFLKLPPLQRASMGLSARKYVLQKFSWDNSTQVLLQVLRSLE